MNIIDLLSSETTISIIGVLLTALASKFGLTAMRKKNVATAIYHAFHIVDDLAQADKSENGLDKTAEALKAADAWMLANGWRPLKETEQVKAKLAWSSMHGQTLTTSP